MVGASDIGVSPEVVAVFYEARVEPDL